MTKTIQITIAFLLLSLLSFTQEPSSYKIGEEELSGIHIYTILQDENEFYWLGTNQGIIKYDGYSFKNIPAPKALGTSFFDLKLDYDKSVFCKNLSGQIFKIKNDTCKVYFQIPDSLISSDINYDFDNNNKMIITAKSIIKLSENRIDFLKIKNISSRL